ncbi:YceI family protein [Aliifodinibius salipaludis]|uniref:YceI family protein n=1 Tax=Fodinibius salipaludis TaxID=2032627 RepID=UPI00159520BE|nr:YceI family protein [Aliifodinibius salipaludis]
MEKVRWQFLLLLTPLLILANISQSGAQSYLLENITIEKGGKVWIEGEAGMISYQCNAENLSGVGKINNPNNPRNNINQEDGEIEISVSLPVEALSCGKRAMDKDMYKALKSDNYPNISYRLLSAELADESSDTTEWMDIHTRGIMEIAGVQDTTSFTVQGKLLNDNRFQVKGSKKIHMDTFNIERPTAMLGLIKASKDLSVHFNVTVQLEEDTTQIK